MKIEPLQLQLQEDPEFEEWLLDLEEEEKKEYEGGPPAPLLPPLCECCTFEAFGGGR